MQVTRYLGTMENLTVGEQPTSGHRFATLFIYRLLISEPIQCLLQSVFKGCLSLKSQYLSSATDVWHTATRLLKMRIVDGSVGDVDNI